ncbi:Iron(II)-dependent oxidoreductase EgtB [Bremerella volcania]|uniref:Iron(II)-dependent oxidoreductase EgtB n=1 Tax=Bremerella volcania TaxID=2527984 RepID=A0A518CD14_9BACT|nr:ergothioneine biosynthesis protein EgtB [Bremerella volcania]QDU77111.1 Iron(II)-dependent oxidoreductase EgtB [Bremerella volcania]
MASIPTDLSTRCSLLLPKYEAVRGFSHVLCEPLEIEDFVVQSMPDASPIRWHLAHTTWFFETFILKRFARNYQSIDPMYEYLFNSYYNGIGEQFPRPQRGLLTRPTVAQVMAYRREVDNRMGQLLLEASPEQSVQIAPLVELGLHHEQQHQELMLTDLKHALAQNPMYPAYESDAEQTTEKATLQSWHEVAGGIVEIGHTGNDFAYDNESPRHEALIPSLEIAGRLITNGEYLQFMDDGGYQRPELWLSLGWNTVQSQQWNAPLYWVRQGEAWHEFTLCGLRRLNEASPVTHVSYFEADAFARWQESRLPTEFEWETASRKVSVEGNFVESRTFHPAPTKETDGLRQMLGDVWEWTNSSYAPYPGFQPSEGAIGEYNGKFMCQQYVLRGGSCATSESHIRKTYRNFFPPEARWQFTGIRLAR